MSDVNDISFRKNPNLKGPNHKEFIDKQEFAFRTKELIRCRKDPHYFASNYFNIVTAWGGNPRREIIKLFPKQSELLSTLVDYNRIVCLASRQSSKTTTYTIFCLWRLIFNREYKILVAANKDSTSLEIIGRVRLAYEMLPNWLKCGIITWNKSTIEFSNGSKITGVPTSSDSGRSGSYNCIDGNSKVKIILNNILYDVTIKELEYILEKNKTNIKVLTDTGFSNFTGVSKQKSSNPMHHIKTSTTEIKCTSDHVLFTKDMKEIETKDIIPGMLLNNSDNIEDCEVLENNIIDGYDEYVYDIVGVENNSRFYANDILVHNCLILDEFAFVPENICEEFWNAVYPIISTDPNSKIIIVSTPNGIGNMFYDFWTQAQYATDKKDWKSFRMDWWDVPGRDEAWKEQTLRDMKYDKIAFGQEYGNEFLSSSYSLVPGKSIKKMMELSEKNKVAVDKFKTFEQGDERFIVDIYEKYQKDHAYVMGGDAADGVGADFSTLGIFDITNTSDIRQAVGFGSNQISPSEFAYIINKIGLMYHAAPLYMECNGVGSAVIELLWNVYEYENILDHGMVKSSTPGIYSSNPIKLEACYWLNKLLSNPDINVTIRDREIINDIPNFAHKKTGNGVTFKAVPGKHDDYIMMFIWAMFGMHSEVIEMFFNVDEYHPSEISKNVIPHKIQPLNSTYFNGENDAMKDRILRGEKTFNQMVGIPQDDSDDDDSGYVLAYV